MFRRNLVLGESIRSIAKAYGCSFQRVSAACQCVRRWLADTQVENDIPALRNQHEQIIGWLLRETLTEWQKSKGSFKTTKARMVRGRVGKGGAQLPDLVTSEQIEQERLGDPRYIQVANELLKSQRAMRGADEPKRTEISGPEGGPLTIATLLKVVAENPPPVPELELHPENVMDVESVLDQLENMPVEGETEPVKDGEFLDAE